MATLFGANYEAAYETEPSSKISVKDQHGRLRVAYDSITLSAELALNDVIEFFKLPKGAKIVDARFSAPSDGTSGQYNVGWQSNGTDAADADGFFVGTVADTGAGAVDVKLASTSAGYRFEFAEETVINAVVAEATTASSGDTLELMVIYVID